MTLGCFDCGLGFFFLIWIGLWFVFPGSGSANHCSLKDDWSRKGDQTSIFGRDRHLMSGLGFFPSGTVVLTIPGFGLMLILFPRG